MINLILIDDHEIFRAGMIQLLNRSDEFKVIASASNGKEMMDLLRTNKPDIILLDINMPVMDGIEATAQCKMNYSDIKIIILSMHNESEYYNKLIDLGADGFVVKNSSFSTLKEAIKRVYSGANYFSQELLMNVLKKKHTEHFDISPREMDVLRLICLGMSSQEISEKLIISQKTVEKHRSALFVKTDTKTSLSLLVFAVKNGLVVIE